jgi:hypothetical protein
MPGKKRCPISGDRGGISTSASPELRLKSWHVLAEGKAHLLGHFRRLVGRATQHDQVAFADDVVADRPALRVLEGDEDKIALVREADGLARLSDERGSCPHAQLVHLTGQLILLDQGGRVLAEVGWKRLAGAVRKETFAEQHHDGDAAQHDRHADQRELEIAEAAASSIR